MYNLYNSSLQYREACNIGSKKGSLKIIQHLTGNQQESLQNLFIF